MSGAVRYRAFGLTIESAIELPEVPKATPDLGTDVRVVIGEPPASLSAPLRSGVLFEAQPGEYLLEVEGVARYYVRDGREVIVAPAAGADPASVRLFLLGSSLTAVLHQRGALVLHAGSCEWRGRTVAFAGASGNGKSTLLACLVARGGSSLADDATVILPDADGALWVQPGFPQVRLWKDAVRRLGLEADEQRRVRTGVEKFAMPLAGADAPRRLDAIVILGMHNGDDIRVSRVEGADAFTALRAQTRNLRVLEGLGQQHAHFAMLSRVAAAVPVWRVVRPRGRETVNDVADRVIECLD